jgi:ornithine cyclodeaminase/alanine dehydrogenase
MKDAINAVEEAFKEFVLGTVEMPVRVSVPVERYSGVMLTMPAYIGGAFDALGQKVVTVYPENREKYNLRTILATVQLFDSKSGECIALLDGTIITAMRTGAVSGVATKYLAPKDSKSAAVFGAGVQAQTQLEAVVEERSIEVARVYDPVEQLAREYCEKMSKKLGINVSAARDPSQAVRGSDILICASTARTPVFKGEWLRPGMHINAIGSYTPDTRELDTATIKRSKVIVDSRTAALKEAGDLLIPIGEKAISSRHIWAELGEIILGKKEGRTSSQEITLFKSVGLALQDVSTAAVAYRKAVEQQKGIKVDI